jgi:hypothetical protein
MLPGGIYIDISGWCCSAMSTVIYRHGECNRRFNPPGCLWLTVGIDVTVYSTVYYNTVSVPYMYSTESRSVGRGVVVL